jgi:hypothetical protein
MKKLIIILTMALMTVPFCKADTDWSGVEAVVNSVYNKIPDAEYQITMWADGDVKYAKASSCEDARRIAYTLLYRGKVDQVKITSKYPTAQTRCWLFGKIFTRSNMDELL